MLCITETLGVHGTLMTSSFGSVATTKSASDAGDVIDDTEAALRQRLVEVRAYS